MCVVIGRNCSEEADASSDDDDDGVAHGRLERQSMLILVPGGGLCGEVLAPLCLLVSASRCISQQKNLLSHFLFPPLVANQDLVLMTSLYSLCFLFPCPTHAYFIFFMHFFLAEVETQEAFGPRLKQWRSMLGSAVLCSEFRGTRGGDRMSFPRWGPAKDVLASESNE